MSVEPGTKDRPKYGVGTVVIHPQFGRGRIVGYEVNSYVLVFTGGEIHKVAFFYDQLQVIDTQGDPELDRIKQAVSEVLGDYGWIESELELGKRWHGGSLVLKPGTEGTQSKEVPLDAFFKKLIGVREKLRVLEQKINNHKTLTPEDKVELEGYISRCYGSLTSFNVLFASKEGQFHGTGKGSSAGE